MSSLLRIARPATAVAARSVRPSAIQFAPLQVVVPQLALPQLPPARSFARAKGLAGRGGRKARPRARSAAVATVDEDPWTAVKDEQSGLVYYWNQKTDETTALGEPKPTGVYAPAPAAGGEMQAHGPGGPGLMGVMKEGMAFGAGAAVARMAVGSIADSMFGGDTGLGDMGDGGDDGENIV
mmetsp:Transcript_18734/g.43612  ORF Transcript_18734/g.43612 Transcript_18734/m.43612 type:complete len:181 (+) Transcript_18734:74-616(+)